MVSKSNRDESDGDQDEGHTQVDGDERLIYFTGGVSESNVSTAIEALFVMSFRDKHKPIHMLIETYGGSVDSMFALYDAMHYIPCEITTIALGKVMSAGVLIFAAGHKGKRLIAPHARLMTHPASGNLEGNIYELQNELSEINRQEELWFDAMVRETGKPRKFFKDLNLKREDQYLTPAQCIKVGIADRFLYDIPTTFKKSTKKSSNTNSSRRRK